jgi:hypothetical protein
MAIEYSKHLFVQNRLKMPGNQGRNHEMSSLIRINGIRLDEVRMPLEPFCQGVVSALTYPPREIRISRSERILTLIIPAYLAVELYRVGILPQDPGIPVSVEVGEDEKTDFLVTDVRYSGTGNRKGRPTRKAPPTPTAPLLDSTATNKVPPELVEPHLIRTLYCIGCTLYLP